MRVALITNALDTPTRGNYTTIQRWLAHARGVDVVALPADPEQTLHPVPDIIHGYHALNGGIAALALARRYRRPLVISLGGTDLLTEQSAAILREAAVVTGAFDSFRFRLDSKVRYATVPRGVEIPAGVLPRAFDGTLRVLLPSGLRPVKDPMLAIDMATALVERGLSLCLRILGPPLDDGYAELVAARVAELRYVTLGEVDPGGMRDAYAGADVVWNTSRSEGGSNALLEAFAHGCAVFARDVPGNRELVPPESLFTPGGDIESFHRKLRDESFDERRKRMDAAHAMLRAQHDPEAEARALEAVWRSVG